MHLMVSFLAHVVSLEVPLRILHHCMDTTKGHISHVGLSAPKCEHIVTYRLERISQVFAYARSDHLDFVTPYEWQGMREEYRPDYPLPWCCSDG